jgi:hypothetical protein
MAIIIADATAETHPNAEYPRRFTFTLTAERLETFVRLQTEIHTYLPASGTYQTATFQPRRVYDDIDDVCQAAEAMEEEVREFLEGERIYDAEFSCSWGDAAERVLYPTREVAVPSAQRLRVWTELKSFITDIREREGMEGSDGLYTLADVLSGVAEDLYQEADGLGSASAAFDRRAGEIRRHLDEMMELKDRIEHPGE